MRKSMNFGKIRFHFLYLGCKPSPLFQADEIIFQVFFWAGVLTVG